MDDLISRQAAIMSMVYADETSHITCGDLANVVKVLQRIPSVQPERKNGRWLQTTRHYKDDEQEYDYIETTCSVCGVKKRIGWTGANYCPNCGSYNGGEEDADRI